MLAYSLWRNSARLKFPHTLLGLCGSSPSPRTFPSSSRSAASRELGGFRDFPKLGLRKFTSLTLASSKLSRFPLQRGYAITPSHGIQLARSLEPRFFSSNSTHFAAPAESLPVLSPPSVGRWLIFSSALVFAVIVVGGVTRLTESGLSITEWRPITGILPRSRMQNGPRNSTNTRRLRNLNCNKTYYYLHCLLILTTVSFMHANL